MKKIFTKSNPGREYLAKIKLFFASGTKKLGIISKLNVFPQYILLTVSEHLLIFSLELIEYIINMFYSLIIWNYSMGTWCLNNWVGGDRLDVSHESGILTHCMSGYKVDGYVT